MWLLEPTGKDCLGKIAGLDLQNATIKQLSKALESGKLTSTQLVEAYLQRIKAYDPKLNSIRHLDVKGALKKAAVSTRSCPATRTRDTTRCSGYPFF